MKSGKRLKKNLSYNNRRHQVLITFYVTLISFITVGNQRICVLSQWRPSLGWSTAVIVPRFYLNWPKVKRFPGFIFMFFVLTQRLPPLCAPLWERPRQHRIPNQYNLNLKIMQLFLNGGGRLLLKRRFLFLAQKLSVNSLTLNVPPQKTTGYVLNPERVPSKTSSIFSRHIPHLIPRTKGKQKKAT